jgi:PAS domain S-box-containing protein
MKKKNKKNPVLSPRAEAEKILAETRGSLAEMEEQTTEKLIHELRVHQIELEMQNEELRSARSTLEETRDKYIDLYDFAPVGYFSFTREALIKEANLIGAALFGLERQTLVNSRFRRWVAPADLDKWDRHIVSAFESGQKHVCDLALTRGDGSAFYARLDSIRIDVKDGTPMVRTAITDITEKKQAEEALQRYSAELEKSNRELQEALSRVKTLSGLLPICAACKKIRDDKGYWKQLEAYVSEHTEAAFSHGICPECEKKAYEELEELKNKSTLNGHGNVKPGDKGF